LQIIVLGVNEGVPQLQIAALILVLGHLLRIVHNNGLGAVAAVW